MTLTDLRYLVTLAEVRHFAKAAEACFVSQPTLSIAIKKLEEELKETKEVLNFINELEDYIASYENTLKRQDNNSVFYEIKLLINLLKFKYTTSQGEYLKFRKIFFLVNGMDTFISMQEKLDAELNYVKYL